MKHPLTVAQVNAKLSQAKSAISNGRCFFGLDSPHLVEELQSLKIGDSQQLWSLVSGLLKEIRPRHQVSAGENRLGFVWKSAYFKQKMKICFAVDEEALYFFSLAAHKQ